MWKPGCIETQAARIDESEGGLLAMVMLSLLRVLYWGVLLLCYC